MSQQVLLVALFMAVVVSLPFLTRWFLKRNALDPATKTAALKIVSAVAVGPSQKVISLEAGQDGNRVLLVLGVTPQQITFLHSLPIQTGSPVSEVRQ